MQRKKVGLALGGGAAKGLAHIGVLEVLQREGIPIDMIAGSSIGALVGAAYAQGKDVSEIKRVAIDLGSRRVSFLLEPAISKTGLIRGRRIENALRSIIGDAKFEDLGIPFACVAADISNGDEVIIKQGLVWPAVRASSSLPVLFSVANWEGRHLLDGSLANPVPVSVVKDMGADFIIAVNVVPHRSQKPFEPNIFNVVMHMLYIVSNCMLKPSLVGADIVIEPQTENIGFLDFHRAGECILQGEMAAQELAPEIKRRYLAQGLVNGD